MTARRQALADLIDDRGEPILHTALSLTALLLVAAIVAGHLGGQGGASRMAIRYLMLAVSVGALLALPSLLVLSGWFLGRREAIALGAVAAIGVGAMGAIEALGLLRPQPRDVLDYLAALLRARAIRDALGQPFEVDGMGLKVGASIGVALYPDHGTDSHQLLRAADVAMYRSKTRSLGVSLYDRSADTHSADRLALVAELADAVTRGERVLYYQPKQDLRDGRITGVEALVRWQHPRRGLLLPGAFIQLAEASEVIHPFTRAVMDLALSDCAKLRRHGLRQSVALNLSARNLVDDRCVQDLERLIALHGLAYGDIELEITETAILHDPALVGRLLDRLDGQGVGLALDDFGTGYSSLAHLKRLPLDALKVDRSFVRDMTTDEQDAIIVRSTIALAHNLGMLVIAEGVENADTERLLRRMDCDMIQGYHVARPMPLDELIAWLGARERESPSRRDAADATDATNASDATNGPVVSARRPAGLPEYQ